MLSAILPIKISEEHCGEDLARSNLLLKSLSYFWKGRRPFEIDVICRPQEIDFVRANHTKFFNLIVRYHNELDVVPELTRYPDVNGWRKQQVIKLAASKIVNTDHYLIFDSDIVCVQEFNETSFIDEGRSQIQWEPFEIHREWWEASREILRSSLPHGIYGMGVSPNIFSRAISSKLFDYLETTYDQSACSYLLYNSKKMWTEYSLYYLFSLTENLFERHHISLENSVNLRKLHSKHSFWRASQYENWRQSIPFGIKADGCFMICQSNTGIPAKEIEDQILKAFRKQIESADLDD